MVAGQSAGCFGSCVLWWHTRCLATSSSVLSIVGHLCYLSCLLPTAPTACWLAIPQCQNAQIYFRLCTCIRFFYIFVFFMYVFVTCSAFCSHCPGVCTPPMVPPTAWHSLIWQLYVWVSAIIKLSLCLGFAFWFSTFSEINFLLVDGDQRWTWNEIFH